MKNTSFEKQYQERGIESQRQYPNEHLIAFIAQNFYKFPIRKDVKILEIGCGSGAQLWYLGKEGFSSYGTDHAPTGLDLCKEVLAKWGTTAVLAESDITDIPFDEEFDAVIDVVSMQHLDMEDHAKTYAEIFRHLKPGGKFFSYHLGDNSIIFRHGGGSRIDLNTVDSVEDLNMPLVHNGLMTFLSPIDAERLLHDSGFINITVDKATRTYENQKYLIEYLVITAQKPL